MDQEKLNLETKEKLEKTIIKVITKIRNSRSRPGYQNVLTHLNRGEYKDLKMDELKAVIDDMVEINIIRKSGEQHESFYVIDNNYEEKNEKSVETFINDEFYSVIINRIKVEVNIALENALKENSLPAVNQTKINDNSESMMKDNVHKDMLIEQLNKQIELFQNELGNKNEIIKTLINDKTIANSSLQTNKENKIVHSKNKIEAKSSNNVEKIDLNEQNFNDVTIKTKIKSRSITILKDIKPYKIRNALTSKERVYVKSFSGATIRDMHEYAMPSMRHNPNLIAIPVGTNDLRSIKSPTEIAQEIIELGMKLKSEENDITINSIVARNDEKLLNEKRQKVNDLVKIKTSELGLGFIDHKDITPQLHCNHSGLHLNYDGTFKLGSNFVQMINA